jgi:hypothetical protein
VNAVTFWGRKHTAHTIGDNGGVTATIERLRAIVAKAKFREQSKTPVEGAFQNTSLVLVGHSFGGALLFSALATSLNARVGNAIQQVPLPQGSRAAVQALQMVRPAILPNRVCMPSTGDLVVLVNPAMEASRFTNLAGTRNLMFAKQQLPIFMTLASEADWAVGGFFGPGQAFTTLSRAARSRDFWLRMDKGFGLYEPFLTHRVVAAPTAAPADAPKAPPRVAGKCRCESNLAASANLILKKLRALYDLVRTTGAGASGVNVDQALDQLRVAGYQEMAMSRLEPVRDVDPNNPFVMATVDPKIVNGHSDIFNAPFMDFLIEYVVRSEIKRNLVRTLPLECGQ